MCEAADVHIYVHKHEVAHVHTHHIHMCEAADMYIVFISMRLHMCTRTTHTHMYEAADVHIRLHKYEVTHVCRCLWRPQKGTYPLGAAITGGCELPDTALGAELRSSKRTESAPKPEPSLQSHPQGILDRVSYWPGAEVG